MQTPPRSNVVVPDYHSKENWDAFVALWPEETRIKAPSYAEAAKNLDDFCEASKKVGMAVNRVKVDVAAWMRWVESNQKPATKESVIEYAAVKFANEIRG